MKNLIIASLILMLALSSCGEFEIFMSHRQEVFLSFENAKGENLIAKNQLKIDSLFDDTGNVTYFIDPNEYKLRVLIDGQQYKTDEIIVEKDRYELPCQMTLTCWEHRPELRGQKRPFVYDFFLSYPKLFGDDKEHKISARWTIVKKAPGAYKLEQLTFDDTVIENMQSVVAIKL